MYVREDKEVDGWVVVKGVFIIVITVDNCRP